MLEEKLTSRQKQKYIVLAGLIYCRDNKRHFYKRNICFFFLWFSKHKFFIEFLISIFIAIEKLCKLRFTLTPRYRHTHIHQQQQRDSEKTNNN